MKTRNKSARWLRRTVQAGLASALSIVGLVAFGAPAFTHDNHSGGAGVGNFSEGAVAPSITVVKSSTTPSYSDVGDLVNYEFLVTNTGNVALSGITVNDTQDAPAVGADLSAVTCPEATLAPGAFETCTAAYSVAQADLNAGSVSDSATASGSPSNSETPVTSLPSTATVPVASIVVVKQVCGSEVATDCGPSGAGPWTGRADIPAGNTAYWRITVTNAGEIALQGVAVSDPVVAACNSSASTTALAVGASVSIYCSSPDVTTALTNVATATFTGEHGTPPSGSAEVSVLVSLAPVTQPSTTVGPATSPATSPAVTAALAPAVTG